MTAARLSKTRARTIGAALVIAAFAAPAAAQQASQICSNAGNVYQVGDYACLPGCHGRQRYARCDAANQIASWTYISDVCPLALLSPADPPVEANFAPARTSMSPVPFEIAMTAIAPEIQERIAGLKVPAAGTKIASR